MRNVLEPSGGPAASGTGRGTLTGAAAMVAVGSSVAVSAELVGAALASAQALRYGLACLLLLAVVRVLGHRTGARLVRPRGVEWTWLGGTTVTGLVLFNVALVEGARHAEPAVFGVAVACVPLLLAAAGPVLDRRPAGWAVVAAAGLVTCGAALVHGFGRSDAAGLGWAVVVLACEAAFTLLAIPVLVRHGAFGVSVHTTWMAAAVFAVLGLLLEGPTAVLSLRAGDLWASAYLAVAVTALAFVLWYSTVRTLGSARAGLLTGIAPVAAAFSGVLLGGPWPHPTVWAGVAVVGAGLVVGLALPEGRRIGPRPPAVRGRGRAHAAPP